jgi:hypothetical protein
LAIIRYCTIGGVIGGPKLEVWYPRPCTYTSPLWLLRPRRRYRTLRCVSGAVYVVVCFPKAGGTGAISHGAQTA